MRSVWLDEEPLVSITPEDLIQLELTSEQRRVTMPQWIALVVARKLMTSVAAAQLRSEATPTPTRLPARPRIANRPT